MSYGQKTTVFINSFENDTGDRTLDWIREGVAIALADHLSVRPELYIYGLNERQDAYERLGIPDTASLSRATAIRIGWEIGADVLITGRLSGTHQKFQIDARILNLEEDSVGSDVTVSGPLEELLSLSATLASRLVRQLVPDATVPETDYAAKPSTPRSAFEAYVRGVIASDPQRRQDLLEEAIRLYPTYWPAIFQLGQVHYLDSDYKASSDLLEKVPAGVPDYPEAQFMLGLNAYHQGNYARAAEIYSALAPGYAVLVNLGAALAARGDPTKASDAWRRALQRDPSGAEAAFDLALLSFNSDDWNGAASRFSQFLQAHPRDAEVQFLLGRAYDRLGRAEEAQRLTSQAIRSSPRLGRWVNQPIPNVTRVRAEFDATELRLLSSIWTEARLSRRLAARTTGQTLPAPRR